MVSKRKLVGHINNIATYAIAYNRLYVPYRRIASLSVFERVILIYQEAKSNVCWYLKMIRECVNLTLYNQDIIESITVKVIKFRGISLQGRASKEYSNVSLDKGSFFEGHKALETLDKEHYVFVVNVFAYRYYLAFFMHFIKMRVEIAKIHLILPFGSL